LIHTVSLLMTDSLRNWFRPHCVILNHRLTIHWLTSHTAPLDFYTVAGCLLSESTAVSHVMSQWEMLPRHRRGGEVESWLVRYHSSGSARFLRHHWRGRGVPSIAWIRHTIHISLMKFWNVFSQLSLFSKKIKGGLLICSSLIYIYI
jgi:hypothetical protein